MSRIINELARLIPENVNDTWLIHEAIKPLRHHDIEFADEDPGIAADYFEEHGGTVDDLARIIYGVRKKLLATLATLRKTGTFEHPEVDRIIRRSLFNYGNVFGHIVHDLRSKRNRDIAFRGALSTLRWLGQQLTRYANREAVPAYLEVTGHDWPAADMMIAAGQAFTAAANELETIATHFHRKLPR